MHKKNIKKLDFFGLLCLVVCLCISESKAQCPWQTDPSSAELQSSCICSTNMAQELSVQCDLVNYEILMQTLDKYSQGTLDLLYINNSSVKTIDDSSFANLKIHNLQLSGCQIETISPTAFKGLELYLRHLSLQDNKIDEIPNLEGLINLTLLDLSRNRISRVPDDVFASLKNLQTIKLADNNLTLSKNAFRGLENSLKNLNLKGTNQKSLPECIRSLKNLAFLDLAQNILSELPGTSAHIFQGLGALTALNLERNVIQSLGEFTFDGVKNTLSSLSLLNNLLTDYPTAAISKLPELRVLDLGFNLIKEIPNDAFLANPSLTLLALDGNPIETIPKKAFTHLNTTLRGLSLGGRYLQCDCRIRWVIEWIKNGDLQVTSRERNPQFCATPSFLKNKHFYKIDPSEMICDNDQSPSDASAVLDTIIEEDDEDSQHPIGTGVGYASPTIVSPEIFPTSKNKFKKNPPIAEVEVVKNTNTSELLGIMETTRIIPSTTESTTVAVDTTTKYFTQNSTNTKPMNTSRKTNLVITRPQTVQTSQKPPLILGTYPKKQVQEVIIRSVHRQDNSVIIQWDSETANILGFRVVYRLFGDRTFKQGPPLETSEREFKIKNVPYQECIIVCVISLEEITITPDTVPYSQCREIRTAVTMTSNMDRITIAASAAICGTVLIAVVVFIAASKRRAKKLQTLHHSVASCHPNKTGIPVGTLPANCYAGPNAAQMSSLAALNAFNSHKDWDQGSVYSNRSLNPSRMYRVADSRQGLNEDLHSNVSNFSAKPPKMRSVADGQSQNSFTNNSMRYLGGTNAYASDLVNSRPELRQSRQSLAVSERMSHISYPGSGRTNTSRNKPRQRSRTREGTQNRPPSRYSHTGSHHTLNNYCGGDTSDNWTDHDMDIYMTRNPTTRNGLVPL